MSRRWYFLLIVCLLLAGLAVLWHQYANSKEARARRLIVELSYLTCDSGKVPFRDRVLLAASVISPYSRSLKEVSEDFAGLGEEVIPTLMAEIRKDKNDNAWCVGNQVRICYVLSAFGSLAVRPLLEEMEATPVENLTARMCLADAIGRIGPDAREAIPRLREDLKSDVPLVRCIAARTLAQIDHELAVREALPTVLIDARGDKPAQFGAARALAKIGPVTAEARQAFEMLTANWRTALQD